MKKVSASASPCVKCQLYLLKACAVSQPGRFPLTEEAALEQCDYARRIAHTYFNDGEYVVVEYVDGTRKIVPVEHLEVL